VKAYSTRVGNGPFPTELANVIGDRLRKTGGEYGATTGRPRRCGWLDAVSLRYSIRINGIQKIAITKLDVLDEFKEIKICTHFRFGGKTLTHYPTDAQTLDQVEPVYHTLKGWQEKTSDIRSYGKLPNEAKTYIETVGKLLDTKIWMVSVGARRDQTLMVR
jgi:adenylosuccinate synthase